jgi:hypothetical protein
MTTSKENPQAAERLSNPLTALLEREGFLDFMENVEEFEQLDTTGNDPRDNIRIREIYQAYEQFPMVVTGLQELWQEKAQARQLKLPPEALKKIEEEILNGIKTEGIEVIERFAKQITEYKELPLRISAKQQEIKTLEAKHGTQNELREQQDEMYEKIDEKNEELQNLTERRKAKDVIEKNTTLIENLEDTTEKILSTTKKNQLKIAWGILENNSNLLMDFVGSPEVQSAILAIKNIGKLGNPLEIIRQIEQDENATDDPEAKDRIAVALSNLQHHLEIPAIKMALDAVLAVPRIRRSIEDTVGNPSMQAVIINNRTVRHESENIGHLLRETSVGDRAASLEGMQDLWQSVEGLRLQIGLIPAAERLAHYGNLIRTGAEGLGRFDEETIEQAKQTFSIKGHLPGIRINEFFAQRSIAKAGRKSEKAEQHIQNLQEAEIAKHRLQIEFDDAREAIFKTFPQAEALLEEMTSQVDKKFETLLSDTSSLKNHFEAADYFDLLVQKDSEDNEIKIVENIGGVGPSGKTVEESKQALREKIQNRMATEVKKTLENLEPKKVTLTGIESKLKKIYADLGASVTDTPNYKEIELAALKKVHTDPTIKLSKRKGLENLFPALAL